MNNVKNMPDEALFLSPTNAITPRYRDAFGFLVSPRKKAVMREIKDGALYAIDNDCFNGGLDAAAFTQTLASHHPYRHNCLFVAVPDVVSDAAATLEQFWQWLPTLRIFDYPVALVTQDGLTPNAVPWDEIAALFIGGSDEHKRGREGGALIAAGKEHDKWVHVGRVNGAESIEGPFWLANSWDGKTVAKDPGNGSRIIGEAVRRVRSKKANQIPLFGGSK